MTWEKPVFSSMVQSIGYDAETESMIVTWKNGSQGAYASVPEDVAFSIAQAASVGEAINREVKPIYPYRRL